MAVNINGSDLITLQTYKDLEGLKSNTDDTRLSAIITSASQLVKTYCGNSLIDFVTEEKIETISVEFPSTKVQLTESPIISVTTVEEKESSADSYTTLSSAEYFVDTITDSIVRLSAGKEKLWETGFGTVKVTYKAGYTTLPADLKLAVCDLVTYYFKGEHKERRTIQGATQQNPASSRRDSISFPDHIKRVLDFYKQY